MKNCFLIWNLFIFRICLTRKTELTKSVNFYLIYWYFEYLSPPNNHAKPPTFFQSAKPIPFLNYRDELQFSTQPRCAEIEPRIRKRNRLGVCSLNYSYHHVIDEMRAKAIAHSKSLYFSAANNVSHILAKQIASVCPTQKQSLITSSVF